MTSLVVTRGGTADQIDLVKQTIANPAIASRPPLCAGLWLYVDELDKSHTISQGIQDATGSFWHGIMHRREGDFGNSHYWFRRVGAHPAMTAIPDYDPHEFIDEVERQHKLGAPGLVALQREEWKVLFEWCCENSR